MKISVLILSILLSATAVKGQSFSSSVEVITTYSQNEKYYLKSIPYDDESPSLRGKTYVYKNGSANPFYVFERGFDSISNDSNNLILGNDGEIIFYAIPWGANERRPGLKSVTIYKKGEILKSYSMAEITGCDENVERCELIYSNYDKVIDKEKSQLGTLNYKKTAKAGVDEKERFLFDFPIFSFDDIVYLTDSKKTVHLFDLKEGNLIRSDNFDSIFERIKYKGRFCKIELQRFDAPTFLKFPKLKDGKNPYQVLADYMGMEIVDPSDEKAEQYKRYRLKVNGNIFQDGGFEIEEIDADAELPKEKI